MMKKGMLCLDYVMKLEYLFGIGARVSELEYSFFFFFKLSIFSTPVERVLLFSHQDHIRDAEKDISCLG